MCIRDRHGMENASETEKLESSIQQVREEIQKLLNALQDSIQKPEYYKEQITELKCKIDKQIQVIANITQKYHSKFANAQQELALREYNQLAQEYTQVKTQLELIYSEKPSSHSEESQKKSDKKKKSKQSQSKFSKEENQSENENQEKGNQGDLVTIVNQLRDEVKSMKENIQSMKEEHRQDIQSMKEEHRQDIQSMKEKHDLEIKNQNEKIENLEKLENIRLYNYIQYDFASKCEQFFIKSLNDEEFQNGRYTINMIYPSNQNPNEQKAFSDKWKKFIDKVKLIDVDIDTKQYTLDIFMKLLDGIKRFRYPLGHIEISKISKDTWKELFDSKTESKFYENLKSLKKSFQIQTENQPLWNLQTELFQGKQCLDPQQQNLMKFLYSLYYSYGP
eukprot:TRINITY_DN5949_c0_g1_i3.p1 TRINITY_DN5949_c0_g1~~TRINITY_DN5949_c0_g1_i3.p1  ORF type:complete len:392 (+),score=85.34 TRINITY_DN5949_c0_g1_i3:172-1347(+)